MNRNKMTVVFDVKDITRLTELHEAHLNGGLICGMVPEILSWGDQVTTPSEIIGRLVELDLFCINNKEVKALIELAEKHQKEE